MKNNKKIYSYIIENKLLIEDLLNDYSNYIYTIIRNSCNFNEEDIEEIVLDVIMTVWKNQNKLDINKEMSSYIAGITKNIIRKKYRDLKSFEFIDDYENNLIDISDIELQFIDKEKNSYIEKQLSKMKPIDKQIFINYYYDNYSIKTISNLYDMSESKIKSKLFRLRKRLKKVFEKGGMFDDR